MDFFGKYMYPGPYKEYQVPMIVAILLQIGIVAMMKNYKTPPML